MNMRFLIIFVSLNILSFCECFWGVSWLWKSSPANQNRAVQYIGEVPVPNVPYEAKTDDEKFLEAARQYTNMQLSELDSCQHKIVLKIRSSCSDMSEEDLAKMSVNLLNCQSAVEGRQQFECTSKMSLRECTSSMDPDTWNAYHLISNRARAVCFAARQQQFRAQSDIAVNKLMQSAYAQISNMEKLKENHEKLSSFTTETLQNVATGQETLLQQQERIKVAHQTLKDFVAVNLKDLTREKALIAAGHKELSKLTEDIKEKLDTASAQLVNQSSEQQDNHQKLVKDIEDIKEQAKMIWNEIEMSTRMILLQHEEASMKYEETLKKLSKINETVSYLLNLMETMQVELHERLSWLNGIIGAAGIYTFCMHIVYLVFGMIATAYVNASAFTRVCLIAIVPLNLAVLYHHGSDSALDFFSMTLIIIASSIVHWFTVSIMIYTNGRKIPSKHSHIGLVTDGSDFIDTKRTEESDVFSFIKSSWNRAREELMKQIAFIHRWIRNMSSSQDLDDFQRNHVNDDNDSHSESDSSGSITYMREILNSREHRFQPIRSNITPMRRPFSSKESFSSPPTPPRSSSSCSTVKRQASRSSTPRPLCTASCRNGLLCRNSALSGQDVCRIHDKELSR